MHKRRLLRPEEKLLISNAARCLDGERAGQLLSDMDCATARSKLPDGSIVGFELDGYERPETWQQRAVPVEMEVDDEDGAEISATLYIDSNDRLLEMELVRRCGGPVVRPRWQTLRLWA